MKEQEMKNKIISPYDKVTVELTLAELVEAVTVLGVGMGNGAYWTLEKVVSKLVDLERSISFVGFNRDTKGHEYVKYADDINEEVFSDYYAQQEQDKEKQKKMKEITAIEQEMKEMQQHIHEATERLKTLKESM
jgi:hypothetical protein